MSSTIRWVVRALGGLLLIVFGYMFCSMQQQLVELQKAKRQREALEGRPANRPTPSEEGRKERKPTPERRPPRPSGR